MGDLIEAFPRLKKNTFELVFGSPKQSDLRTVKDLSIWHTSRRAAADHVAGLGNNSKVVTMKRRNPKMWMLDTLTLLVHAKGDTVAYANVNIGPVPLPSFPTTLTIEGDTKTLEFGFSRFQFPDIPDEFKLYMLEG
eukprot:1009968_1